MRALVRPKGDTPPASNASDKPNIFVLGKHMAVDGSTSVTNSEMNLVATHKNRLLFFVHSFRPPCLTQFIEEIRR